MYCVRSQWVVICGGSERDFREAAAAVDCSEERVAVESDGPELSALKRLGAVPPRTARATLIAAQFAAAVTSGGGARGAGVDPHVVLARLLWEGVTPLPGQLPPPVASDAEPDDEPGARAMRRRRRSERRPYRLGFTLTPMYSPPPRAQAIHTL